MKSLNLSTILSFTITTLLFTTYPAFGEDALYIDETGIVGIGTTDLDGTPETGQLTIKGTTSDGSSNILVGRDSDESNVFSVDTDGKITGLSFTGNTITLSESVTDDTIELQLYTDMTPTTTSSSTSYHIGSAHYIRPIINSGITQSGYEMGNRIHSFRNSNGSSADDNGTLASLYGQHIQYGHNYTNPSATPITTTVYGIRLDPYFRTGTVTNWYDFYIGSGSSGGTITNRYAIYQVSSVAKNYFGGNVGIGTTSPSYQLQLASDSAAKPNGGSWSSTSDIRLKTDIKKLTDATDRIMQYPRPILFKWKNPEEHQDITRDVVGLSAQELEKANPDMVIEAEETIQDTETISKDSELTDGNTKAIYFSNEFFALQLGAVQELIERVEALEAENQLIKTEVCKGNNSYSFCKEDNK